jgi:hypothetical protein
LEVVQVLGEEERVLGEHGSERLGFDSVVDKEPSGREVDGFIAWLQKFMAKDKDNDQAGLVHEKKS